MKYIKIFTFLFTIVVLASGCYKDAFEFMPEEVLEPEIEIKGDVNDFTRSFEEESDSLTFKASEGLFIVTKNMTVINVQPGSFIDEEGNIINGEIDLKYIEILNPGDYLFYDLPTIANGQRLRTEGVFRIEAYHNGRKAFTKYNEAITVRLPSEKPEEGMQLFYGEGEGRDFTWELVSDITGTDSNLTITEWIFQNDSLPNTFLEGSGYLFSCDLFTWINVDIFADIPENEKTEVCVELPEIYTPTNTVVFMFFNGEKSILGLYPDAEEKKWCEPYGETPIGYRVTLLVVSSQGEDEFHFGIQELEIKEETTVFIEPEPKSLDEIEEIIKKLE